MRSFPAPALIALATIAVLGAGMFAYFNQRAPALVTNATPVSSTTDATTTPVSTTTDDGAPRAAPTGATTLMAWLFPGKLECTAQAEYAAHPVTFLKPQYFTVNWDGTLTLLTAAQKGCNGYSAANIADIKAHSTYQYVTVASDIDSMNALTASKSTEDAAIAQLVDFATTNDVTGIEIDFEDFASWDRPTYANYISFTDALGAALHAKGKKLMVDIPPIANATEAGYYPLTYADMAKTPADYLVIMAYDYQYDQGAGQPIAPTAWVQAVIQNAKNAIGTDRLVIGVPSYGYSGATNGFGITRMNYSQMSAVPGFSTAPRDPSSGERIFTVGKTSYVYVDQETLDAERAMIAAAGIRYISVWSLGNNPWF